MVMLHSVGVLYQGYTRIGIILTFLGAAVTEWLAIYIEISIKNTLSLDVRYFTVGG